MRTKGMKNKNVIYRDFPRHAYFKRKFLLRRFHFTQTFFSYTYMYLGVHIWMYINTHILYSQSISKVQQYVFICIMFCVVRIVVFVQLRHYCRVGSAAASLDLFIPHYNSNYLIYWLYAVQLCRTRPPPTHFICNKLCIYIYIYISLQLVNENGRLNFTFYCRSVCLVYFR